jgi:hypothetical protein
MGFLEDFWANINAGATTIATAPDPYTNIGHSRNKTEPSVTSGGTVYYPPTSTTTGNTPANTTKADIAQLYRIHGEQESRITDAWKHRLNIEAKVDPAIETFHRLHQEQEGRISENADAIATHGHNYAGIDHTHPNGNGGIPWYVMIVGVLAGALVIYMLLKKGIFG